MVLPDICPVTLLSSTLWPVRSSTYLYSVSSFSAALATRISFKESKYKFLKEFSFCPKTDSVLSVALFDKPAYKNCVVHGTVLAKDGKKLSKKSKNYTDPMELMKNFGTDAFRLYMYDSNAMLVNDMQFDENGIKESLQQIILPLWNCAYFYQSYSQIDNFVGDINTKPNSSNKLDKWILSKLYDVEKSIKNSMDNYMVDEYVKPIISSSVLPVSPSAGGLFTISLSSS